MNEKKDWFAALAQLNQHHPTWEGVPVAIIGLACDNGVPKKCYVRKLNGRRNAWEGWVPLRQIEQREGRQGSR
jgi:hypothetical protein